jgi:hypothetical protein
VFVFFGLRTEFLNIIAYLEEFRRQMVNNNVFAPHLPTASWAEAPVAPPYIRFWAHIMKPALKTMVKVFT